VCCVKQATMEPLHIIYLTKTINVHVDASDYAVGTVVSYTDDSGNERPVAFASKKLNKTQRGWATIEKEAYAAICWRCYDSYYHND